MTAQAVRRSQMTAEATAKTSKSPTGLGAVSMNKIAQELGTAPMPLFRYV